MNSTTREYPQTAKGVMDYLGNELAMLMDTKAYCDDPKYWGKAVNYKQAITEEMTYDQISHEAWIDSEDARIDSALDK